MQHSKLAPTSCNNDEIFRICTKICQELQVIGKDQDFIVRVLALRERLACGVNTLQQRTISTEDKSYFTILENALQDVDTHLNTLQQPQQLFEAALLEVVAELAQLVKVYEDMLLYDDFEEDYTAIASVCLRDYMDIIWSSEYPLLHAHSNKADELHTLFKNSFFAFAEAKKQLEIQKNEEFSTPFWWFTTDPQQVSQNHYDTAFDSMVAPCYQQAATLPAELKQALATYAQDRQQFSLNVDKLKSKVGKSLEWLRQQGSLSLEALCQLPLADNVIPVAAQQKQNRKSGKLFIYKNGVINDLNCINIDFFEYNPGGTPAVFAAKVEPGIIAADSQLYAIWETQTPLRTIKPQTHELDVNSNRLLIEFDDKLDENGRLLISLFIHE